jgi:hypothetical protein
MASIYSYSPHLYQTLDFTPIASTLINGRAIWDKYFLIPTLSAEQIKQNPYHSLIQQKSYILCALLLIPIIGNILYAAFKLGHWALAHCIPPKPSNRPLQPPTSSNTIPPPPSNQSAQATVPCSSPLNGQGPSTRRQISNNLEVPSDAPHQSTHLQQALFSESLNGPNDAQILQMYCNTLLEDKDCLDTLDYARKIIGSDNVEIDTSVVLDRALLCSQTLREIIGWQLILEDPSPTLPLGLQRSLQHIWTGVPPNDSDELPPFPTLMFQVHCLFLATTAAAIDTYSGDLIPTIDNVLSGKITPHMLEMYADELQEASVTPIVQATLFTPNHSKFLVQWQADRTRLTDKTSVPYTTENQPLLQAYLYSTIDKSCLDPEEQTFNIDRTREELEHLQFGITHLPEIYKSNENTPVLPLIQRSIVPITGILSEEITCLIDQQAPFFQLFQNNLREYFDLLSTAIPLLKPLPSKETFLTTLTQCFIEATAQAIIPREGPESLNNTEKRVLAPNCKLAIAHLNNILVITALLRKQSLEEAMLSQLNQLREQLGLSSQPNGTEEALLEIETSIQSLKDEYVELWREQLSATGHL